jgi:hypothetical protein
MVNGKGRDITDEDLIATAAKVDISTHTAKEMIEAVGSAIAEI